MENIEDLICNAYEKFYSVLANEITNPDGTVDLESAADILNSTQDFVNEFMSSEYVDDVKITMGMVMSIIGYMEVGAKAFYLPDLKAGTYETALPVTDIGKEDFILSYYAKDPSIEQAIKNHLGISMYEANERYNKTLSFEFLEDMLYDNVVTFLRAFEWPVNYVWANHFYHRCDELYE